MGEIKIFVGAFGKEHTYSVKECEKGIEYFEEMCNANGWKILMVGSIAMTHSEILNNTTLRKDTDIVCYARERLFLEYQKFVRTIDVCKNKMLVDKE